MNSAMYMMENKKQKVSQTRDSRHSSALAPTIQRATAKIAEQDTELLVYKFHAHNLTLLSWRFPGEVYLRRVSVKNKSIA